MIMNEYFAEIFAWIAAQTCHEQDKRRRRKISLWIGQEKKVIYSFDIIVQ